MNRRNRWNRWTIHKDENGRNYTAEFGPEDFERWWLAGMDDEDPISDDYRREMFDAMVYLAEAEGREIVQTAAQLRDAIDYWADAWNKRIANGLGR